MENKLNRSGMWTSIQKMDETIGKHRHELLSQEWTGKKISPEPNTYDSLAYDFVNKLYNQDVMYKTNKDTELAQTFLKKIGFYEGEVDGLYGNETKRAIKSYTEKNVDKAIWSKVKGSWDNFLNKF